MTQQRTAIFVGSFDPFTVGHADIVARTLALFDRVVIGVGVNERKRCMLPAEERVESIRRLYAADGRVEVKPYADLTVDFARREGAVCIVRGVRSVRDFEYEREQADVNRHISGIDTLLLYADPRHASVSSSMVRELLHFGHPVEEFLPQPPKQIEE